MPWVCLVFFLFRCLSAWLNFARAEWCAMAWKMGLRMVGETPDQKAVPSGFECGVTNTPSFADRKLGSGCLTGRSSAMGVGVACGPLTAMEGHAHQALQPPPSLPCRFLTLSPLLLATLPKTPSPPMRSGLSGLRNNRTDFCMAGNKVYCPFVRMTPSACKHFQPGNGSQGAMIDLGSILGRLPCRPALPFPVPLRDWRGGFPNKSSGL